MTTPPGETPHWCGEIIDRFRNQNEQTPERIAALARRLALSGDLLDRRPEAMDVASTGGPASLTTFIPPLVLAAAGRLVPKIGVPGRPAGVIDTFGVLPGYVTLHTRQAFLETLQACGFASTIAAGVFTPEDGILFNARQRLGAQDMPPLVMASLLSKKIAAGISRVVFDVRTFQGGNFGKTAQEAAKNCSVLMETGHLVGIEVFPSISNGESAPQPMIGRAEALKGLLGILRGQGTPWLERHFEECVKLAQLADPALNMAMPTRQQIIATLDAHLRTQGTAGIAAIDDYIDGIERRHSWRTLVSPDTGTLHLSMAQVRDGILRHQGTGKEQSKGAFADECGIELLKNSGELVRVGEPVLLARASSSERLESFASDLYGAIKVVNHQEAL